jgi:hypothetical protein
MQDLRAEFGLRRESETVKRVMELSSASWISDTLDLILDSKNPTEKRKAAVLRALQNAPQCVLCCQTHTSAASAAV